jgi:hypothetical protein
MTMMGSVQNNSHVHCNTPSSKTFTPLAYNDNVTLSCKKIEKHREAPLVISKDVGLVINNEKGISKQREKSKFMSCHQNAG